MIKSIFSGVLMSISIMPSGNAAPEDEGICTRVLRTVIGPPCQYFITQGTATRNYEYQTIIKNKDNIFCKETGGCIEIGWYSNNTREAPNKDKAAILYFGGNAQDTMEHDSFLDNLSEKTGVDVYTINYPGFGESEGGRWLSNTFDNSTAAADTLAQHLLEQGYSTFLPIGWSFGASIAAYIAKGYKTPILGLNSPFFSARSAVKGITSQIFPAIIHEYAIGPLADIALAENELNTGALLKEISHKIEVVLAHGKEDRVISYNDSQMLNDVMNGNEYISQKFYSITYGDHGSSISAGNLGNAHFIEKVNALTKKGQ